MGICKREKGIVGTSVSTAHSLSLLLVRPLVRMWFSKSLSRELRMRLKRFVSNLRGRCVALKDLHLRRETPGLRLSIEKRCEGIDFVEPRGYRDGNVTFVFARSQCWALDIRSLLLSLWVQSRTEFTLH